MLAAYHGHAPLVRLLVEHGGDPNRLNDRGQSPLAGAVFKMEDAVIEVCFNVSPAPWLNLVPPNSRRGPRMMGDSRLTSVAYRSSCRAGRIRMLVIPLRWSQSPCLTKGTSGGHGLRVLMVVRRKRQGWTPGQEQQQG